MSDGMRMRNIANIRSTGYGVSPATQTGGGAVRTESLDSDVKRTTFGDDEKQKKKKALKKALDFDELLKAMDLILEHRPDFNEEAAAALVKYILLKGER
jgi:hypothetical protein